MKNIKIYMLLAATMLMVAACGSWLYCIKTVRDIRLSHSGHSTRMLTSVFL